MYTKIHRINRTRVHAKATAQPALLAPHYDCMDLPSAIRLTLYVPGVEASGVDITTGGPDLVVTACKTHLVRANWPALHLESVQRDYQLKLRLGTGYDFDALQASVSRGVLTIVLPKVLSASAGRPARQRQVA